MENLGNFEDLQFSEEQLVYVHNLSNKIMESALQYSSDPNSRIVFLYKSLDKINQDAFDKDTINKPSCSKGCSYCCSIKVIASEDEVNLILNYCDSINLILTDEEINRLKEQSKIIDEFEYMFSTYKRCVFLNQNSGECRIYDARPSACRNYYVFSDPENCNTDKRIVENTDGRVLTNFNLNSYAILMVILQLSNIGSFSELLLNKLNKNN